MKERKTSITAFYIETVLMIIIFVLVILVLTQVFGISRQRSAEARQETNAVCLAQNTAQAVAASEDMEGLQLLLDENHNAKIIGEGKDRYVAATYDNSLNPDPAGTMEVQATWIPKEGKQGTFVSSEIRVYDRSNSKSPVYEIDTGIYVQEESE